MWLSPQTWEPWGYPFLHELIERVIELNHRRCLLRTSFAVVLLICADRLYTMTWTESVSVSELPFLQHWWIQELLDIPPDWLLAMKCLLQTWFWVNLKVDLCNDPIRSLWVKGSVLWVLPFQKWSFEESLNNKTCRIVMVPEVVKTCSWPRCWR